MASRISSINSMAEAWYIYNTRCSCLLFEPILVEDKKTVCLQRLA